MWRLISLLLGFESEMFPTDYDMDSWSPGSGMILCGLLGGGGLAGRHRSPGRDLGKFCQVPGPVCSLLSGLL